MPIKRLLLLLACALYCNAGFSQGCPPNIDFEQGTFDGWQCFVGTTRVETGKNIIDLAPSGPLMGRHEMINASSLGVKDQYGNFPVLCPYGGNASVKLGNNQSQYEAEGLSYTFTVPNVVDTFSFTYYYAVVFQDPKHNDYEQPRFFVTAYDVESGELINCASYDYIATSGIPGFKHSTVQSDVLYKEWSPVTIQFAGLANRQVRLEFKTADCTQGGHFGYAYVDVGSGCSNILATAPYCIETNSVILNAPYGFKSYTWYNEDFSQIIGTDQSVTLSPPPATSGTFFVDIVPYPGYGCRDTASAIVTPRPVPPPLTPAPLTVLCQNKPVLDLNITADRGNDLVWYTTETEINGSYEQPVIPTTIALDMTFWVSQKELFGCESLRSLFNVRIQKTPDVSFTTNGIQQCLKENKFEFASTSSNLEASKFNWNFGDGLIETSATDQTSHSYSSHGQYLVRLMITNDGNCPQESLTYVTVGAQPVAAFRAPPVICENQGAVQLLDNSFVPGGASATAGWWWSIDDKINNGQLPALFTPVGHNDVIVRMAVKSSIGCQSDTITRALPIRYRPIPKFTYSSLLCNNEPIDFRDQSTMPAASADHVSKWYWQLDQGSIINLKDPVMHINSGMHQVKLIAESDQGCKSAVAETSLFIHPKPNISLSINDSCVRKLITYEASSRLGNVNTWLWDFGTGQYQTGPRHTRTYISEARFPVVVIGKTEEGCKDTVSRAFRIFENFSNAGSDTIVAKNEPVQLDAGGGQGVRYMWSPAIGLNNASIEKPVATMEADQLYKLYAISEQGCETISDIFIKRYLGPELYIPNAFTPDNDGKNDLLKVFPVGIRKFHYLAIYSRTGQLVYRTSNYEQGWNGMLSGKKMDSGTYIAVAQAEDYRGRPMKQKTTVLLLR